MVSFKDFDFKTHIYKTNILSSAKKKVENLSHTNKKWLRLARNALYRIARIFGVRPHHVRNQRVAYVLLVYGQCTSLTFAVALVGNGC